MYYFNNNWNILDRLLNQQHRKMINKKNIKIVKVMCYSIQLVQKKCNNKKISKMMK